ncbi:MAG: hypothetical protein CL526_04295 [Aequorivita sp.]|nr:hypothetical protein [Aequorivita sp.]|tara:strand:+ start:36135 stop:36605 length:471 start_codon:yes stop_codon:yes gene_type:complete
MKSKNTLKHMGLEIKGYLFFCFILTFSLLGCVKKSSFCYSVNKLNLPVDVPSRSPVFYEIKEPLIIEKIRGEHIVSNRFKSNIKRVIVVEGNDTVDDNEFLIDLEKINNYMNIRFRTARYILKFKDSISAMDQIKKEHLILELYNGEIIKLNYCDK